MEASRHRLRALLLQMLRRDDELRLSQGVQDRYALQPDSWDWKWEVTDGVQRQVCEEFGFVESLEEGLDLLRSAVALFPNDEEVRRVAHYLRHNIHIDCPISVGGVVPDLTLQGLDGVPTSLHDVTKAGRATVVFTGSHT